MKYISVVVFLISIAFLGSDARSQENVSVLHFDDVMARNILSEIIEQGNIDSREQATAWIVLGTVALGVGLEHCGFQSGSDTSFLWKPALDALPLEEVRLLNRVVTSNYRTAERNTSMDSLYPITRQAILFLSDNNGNFDCQQVAGVWEAGMNYVRARGL